MGIIRYAENHDRYYKAILDEKRLDYEMIAEFRYVLVMHAECPLAKKETITFDDMTDYIEISHADPYGPSLPLSEVKKSELPDNIHRKIFVFERSSQFDLLSLNPRTFMWVSPISEEMLRRYGLVQRECGGNRRVYKDVLVHRKDYTLTKLDNLFLEQLIRAKRETLKTEVGQEG